MAGSKDRFIDQQPEWGREEPLDRLAAFHQNREAAAFRSGHLFVLLLGPSSVGKTTLIRSLNDITGDQFVYPRPYTTRESRKNDDKITVSDEEFDELEQQGSLLQVNHLYGARYGPPKARVRSILADGKTPILDFPLGKVGELQRPEYDLLQVYVFPPTLAKWEDKLRSMQRNNTQMRVDAGIQEIQQLSRAARPHLDIHASVVNHEHQEYRAAEEIAAFIDEVRGRQNRK